MQYGRFTARTTGLDLWLGVVSRVGIDTVHGTSSGTRQRWIDAVDTLVRQYGLGTAKASKNEALTRLAHEIGVEGFSPEVGAALVQVIDLLAPLGEPVDLRLFYPRASDTWLEQAGESWDLIQQWAEHGGGLPREVAFAEQPVDRARAWLNDEWVDGYGRTIVNSKEVAAWVACERVRCYRPQEDVPSIVDGIIAQEQVSGLEQRISELEAALAHAQEAERAAQSRFVTERQEHISDIAVVQRVFWKEAWERSWCSEAEQVIGEMNEDLVMKISTDRHANRPEQEWTVSGYVSVKVKDSREEWECSNHDFSIDGVMAVSSDEACDKVRDGEYDDEVLDSVVSNMRNHGWPERFLSDVSLDDEYDNLSASC